MAQFTPQAKLIWDAIPNGIHQQLLKNVYCLQCRGSTEIIEFTGQVKKGDLVLYGKCIHCGHKVARLIEGQ